MAPSFFGSSSSGTSSVKYFEIRLESSNLIFRGTEDEASSVVLKGNLVLCLSEPLRIQGIRLRFTGERKLGWPQPSGSGASLVKQEDEFFRKTWDFSNKCTRSQTLPAGNYEYPFDMILPGSTPESIEGLSDIYVIYRMKATIERNILSQNFVARKQVRVIRTLETASLELAHAMSIDNIWPEKINYSLSTPSKAVIFGTNVQVDFKLIPLLKGLRIGRITTELNEKLEMTIRGYTRSHRVTRLIVRDEHRLPEDARTEDIEGHEGYQFSRFLHLPQSLKNCIQTVDALGIKIRHNLSFNIQMHNPDGHVSELHATLPLFIFISPNMPLDDDNNMINRDSHSMDVAIAMEALTPPQYGEHLFDQLYSDIDPSGYITPAGGASGIGTPFQSRSRSVSTENLIPLSGVASSELAANVLQTRLGNLDMAGSNPVVRDRQLERSRLTSSGDGTNEDGSFELPRSDDGSIRQTSLPCGGYIGHPRSETAQQIPSGSNPISRRVSSEDEISGPVTPQHIEYSANSLAKVPSYTTALQSQTRSPINDGLPTYQSATRASVVEAPVPLTHPR